MVDLLKTGKSPMRAVPLRKHWKAAELFSGISAEMLQLSDLEKAANQSIFWRSICSEHDARHFYRRLMTHGPELPWKLEEFLPTWLADEVNHARGFKILYHNLYGMSVEDIESSLQTRVIDFAHIEEFFSSLLSLCLLFAYDELVTTRVYYQSIPFYEQLGFPAASEWIRRLVYDETQHFRAVMKILTEHCQHEIDRAESLLMRIIEVDLGQDEYRGTFVLDHACPEFPFSRDDLVKLVRQGILLRLHRSPQAARGNAGR
jgi:rubrerythrin